MPTLGLHIYVIYSPHVNSLWWWGTTATNESKDNLVFHNYLAFAIRNFSSPPVKVSTTKQGVSSFYKNQLKQQWQKLIAKAQFLPPYEKLYNEKHWPVLYSDSDSRRQKSSPNS